MCKICNSQEVIYSGIDAFCLGVPVGVICYACANTSYKVERLLKEEAK